MNTSAIRRLYAPFQKLTGRLLPTFEQWGWDNGFMQRANNAAGTDSIDLIGADSSNRLLLGGALQSPLLTPLIFPIQTSSKVSSAAFFVNINSGPLEIVSIQEIHSVANGAAMTAFVSKEGTGQAPGAGSSAMSGTFDMNGTANTLQTATLAGVRGYPSLVLNAGEQLSLKLSTTITSLAGVCVVVWVRPFTALPPASLFFAANGDIATNTIYLNAIPGNKVRAVAVRWSTAGSGAGTVTVDVTKDTGTDAPGAGTSVLGAALSVKTTANVTMFPALATSAATLTMAVGNRLAVKMTGTLTALAGLVVTVFFESTSEDYLVIPLPTWDGPSTSRVAFISNSWYTFVGALLVWSTASGTSGAVTITADRGTTAPGGGTALLTGTKDMTATANTVVEGAPVVTTPSIMTIAPGDRLALLFSGTPNGTAGTFAALILRKA